MHLWPRKAEPVEPPARPARAHTDHIVCVMCGDGATHIVQYIRPMGLAPKSYPYCNGCDDVTYHVLVVTTTP